MVGTAAAQESDTSHPAATAPQGKQLTFQTMDGDSQRVYPEEIWRIRATFTSEEPPGAVVIDYGSERVFVKESLASVVERVAPLRHLEKFTLPVGGPVYIGAARVTGVIRAIPNLSHPKARAIIVSLEGRTQVQETREAIIEVIDLTVPANGRE
jgi:hypothetical protein